MNEVMRSLIPMTVCVTVHTNPVCAAVHTGSFNATYVSELITILCATFLQVVTLRRI